jgi:hypothetical protein
MNIQKIILGTLGLQLTACDTKQPLVADRDGGCDEYAFELSTEITTNSVLFSGVGSSNIGNIESCEDLCSEVYSVQTMADVRSVDACETNVDLAELNSDLQASSDTGNAGDTATTQDTANPKVYGTVDCTGTAMPFCMGRRPMGHIEHQTSNQDLGNHFANCAYLEAASVDAFIELAEQLRSWGAPEELIQRCLVAAEEERNHTMLMDILAKRYGGSRPEPSADPQSNTTLFEVALHNAVEGCINEAWAACVATHQSVHADESLQSTFSQIAKDEIEHAQLSWDLHEWFRTQLSSEKRREVEVAQLEAIRQLQHHSSTDHPNATFLGLCMPEQDIALRRRFTEQLAA